MKLHDLKFLPLLVFGILLGSCQGPPTDEKLISSLKRDLTFLAADDLE